MEQDSQGRRIREKQPLKGLRGMIAGRMRKSILEFPQGTLQAPVRMDALTAYRAELKAKGIHVTFGDLFVKAAACALEDNMALNGSCQGNELIYYDSINISMMASINDVLMEPVVQEAQGKTVEEISAELKASYENIRAGKLMRVPLSGATFSISNLGTFDIDGFTPLLSPPCGAILGIGAIRKVPIVDGAGNIAVCAQVVVSLTTDHALVDGVAAARFIQSFQRVCAEPERYMHAKRAE